jgi:hypothetical protein
LDSDFLFGSSGYAPSPDTLAPVKLCDAGGAACRARLFRELVDRIEARELTNLLKDPPPKLGLPVAVASAPLRRPEETSTSFRGCAGCVGPVSA